MNYCITCDDRRSVDKGLNPYIFSDRSGSAVLYALRTERTLASEGIGEGGMITGEGLASPSPFPTS